MYVLRHLLLSGYSYNLNFGRSSQIMYVMVKLSLCVNFEDYGLLCLVQI